MSETLKRITVEEVKAAYAKTGITPERGMWCNGMGTCACGLCVLFLADGGIPGRAFSQAIYPRLGIEHDYGSGFIVGFDGEGLEDENAIMRLGYLDGQACAAAVFTQEQS